MPKSRQSGRAPFPIVSHYGDRRYRLPKTIAPLNAAVRMPVNMTFIIRKRYETDHYRPAAEMQTGEGKTLAATMPLYLNALTGKGAYLITTNDYLAKRDFLETLRNPSKVNLPVSIPDTASAVAKAVGPGTER